MLVIDESDARDAAALEKRADAFLAELKARGVGAKPKAKAKPKRK